MPRKISIVRIFLIVLTVITIILYLIACVCPFINTSEDWYLALPGLVFPLIFFALVFFILLWIILRSKWWIISTIVLVLGFQQVFVAFAFHLPAKFSSEKAPHTIRVLQWNVAGWSQYNRGSDTGSNHSDMMKLIKQQNADVLCFEEYFDYLNHNNPEPNEAAITALGYPYHFLIATEYSINDYETGIAIFSKFPMVDTSSYAYRVNREKEHLLYCDIAVGPSTFRIFATHLQSVHFEKKEYTSLSDLKHADESGLSDSRTIVSKLKKGFISRYKQAAIVRQKIKESPFPSIICGDFNDVPNSSTYFKIRGDLQDAFLEKGVFIGRTFRFISPTLRIDYILADRKFKVRQFQRIKVPYSDHYPVEADLEY